jgi:hypothetical protein
MKERHKSQKECKHLVPEEGQRRLLCRYTSSSRCPSLSAREPEFSDETIASLVELGKVLRKIHDDLIAEGYTIVDGKITKPTQQDAENRQQ